MAHLTIHDFRHMSFLGIVPCYQAKHGSAQPIQRARYVTTWLQKWQLFCADHGPGVQWGSSVDPRPDRWDPVGDRLTSELSTTRSWPENEGVTPKYEVEAPKHKVEVEIRCTIAGG